MFDKYKTFGGTTTAASTQIKWVLIISQFYFCPLSGVTLASKLPHFEGPLKNLAFKEFKGVDTKTGLHMVNAVPDFFMELFGEDVIMNVNEDDATVVMEEEENEGVGDVEVSDNDEVVSIACSSCIRWP